MDDGSVRNAAVVVDGGVVVVVYPSARVESDRSRIPNNAADVDDEMGVVAAAETKNQGQITSFSSSSASIHLFPAKVICISRAV